MSQYLHLGAGNIILPVTADPYHLAPMPAICHEPNWVNVDKYQNPGVESLLQQARGELDQAKRTDPQGYTARIVEMLNRGVTPVVCQKGSVGASGDLAACDSLWSEAPSGSEYEEFGRVFLPGGAAPGGHFRRGGAVGGGGVHLRARVEQVPHGRERGPDAAVVLHRARFFVERHVEVHAHEYAFAFEMQFHNVLQ